MALTVDNTGPTLTAGAVSRTSHTEATVKFTSSEAGTCYYAVVESGAAAPTIDTSGAGTACAAAEQTISLTSLTAGAKDIYIVVKDAAGNVSSALKIEIPAYVAPVYSISADTTTLNFGSVQTGYTTPAAQTITVTNTGNQQITLTQPTASHYTIGALSKADLAAGETATFTVQPKSGLAAGTYNERITVKGASGGNSTNEISIWANFTVQSHKPFNFTDVPQIPGNWKYESIKYVYDRGIMGGVGGSSQFQPDHPLTRAMFATVLYRMAGEPETGYSSRFSDVKAGQWYSSAILWASSKGIVQGYSDGSYGINHNITREQIAKMLYLYGESRGYDVSGASS
ncbi:MAG: S-layer homology domain-containing protein, partial [Lachnospiraceae bacterium]|nr:S-layer homology domain-containing protein [Lachnospiraceae bacterium]